MHDISLLHLPVEHIDNIWKLNYNIYIKLYPKSFFRCNNEYYMHWIILFYFNF
mgnify:CR=1 FL=1